MAEPFLIPALGARIILVRALLKRYVRTRVCNVHLVSMPHFILASSSPRRQNLLQDAGFDFETVPSPAEEIHDTTLPLHELCEYNARLKAEAIAAQHPEAVVLGADTLVYLEQMPLGKPKNRAEALEVLRSLSAKTHEVCTGLCLIQGERVFAFSEITEVTFKTLTEQIIQQYMSLVNVMDKAGSYALQEHGDLIIESVRGSHSNVIGLPIKRATRELAQFQITPSTPASLS